MAAGELADVMTFYGNWYQQLIRPLEDEAREIGIPRHNWGERSDTGRPGARGWPFADVDAEQLALAFDQGVPDVAGAGELCSSCALNAAHSSEAPA